MTKSELGTMADQGQTVIKCDTRRSTMAELNLLAELKLQAELRSGCLTKVRP